MEYRTIRETYKSARRNYYTKQFCKFVLWIKKNPKKVAIKIGSLLELIIVQPIFYKIAANDTEMTNMVHLIGLMFLMLVIFNWESIRKN